MFHLVRYSIIWKVKNFNIFFWPFIFPIILGTLFYIAFGNVKEADFEIIPVAVVEETKDSRVFLEFLEELQKNGTIQVEKMEVREAEQALKEQKIEGILYAADTPYLKVNKNGLSQSVLQSILESYFDGKKTIENVMKNSPEKLGTALERMAVHQNMVRQVSLGGSTTDGNASYFYALKDMKQLSFFYPELEKMIGTEQTKTYHDEDAFDHVMLVVEEAAKYKDLAMMPRYFMYAALFHDIGKIDQNQRHTIIGQAIAKEALERFTNEKYLLKYVQKAIGLHMDVLNMYKDKSKDAKIIRLLDKFKYPKDLLLLALCDIKGRKSDYYSDEMIEDYILWAKKSLKIYEEFKDRPRLGGRDILALGYRGPIVKKILARARYLEAAIQDEKEVLKIIRKEFP